MTGSIGHQLQLPSLCLPSHSNHILMFAGQGCVQGGEGGWQAGQVIVVVSCSCFLLTLVLSTWCLVIGVVCKFVYCGF